MDTFTLGKNMDKPIFCVKPTAKWAWELNYRSKVMDTVCEGESVECGCNLMVPDLGGKFRAQAFEVGKKSCGVSWGHSGLCVERRSESFRDVGERPLVEGPFLTHLFINSASRGELVDRCAEGNPELC